jgi:uncharacterized protein (TIGR00369 family)
MNENHYRKLERLYASAPINQFYGPTIKISEGTASISLKVQEKFFHSADAVHGSIYFKLMDDAAFFAANSLVDDVFLLTTSFTVYLLRPVVEGDLEGGGRVIHQSKRLFVAQTDLFDAQGRKVGYGSGSFMKSKIHLSPDIGYQ